MRSAVCGHSYSSDTSGVKVVLAVELRLSLTYRLGVATQDASDVLDPSIPQLGRFDRGRTPSIVLSQGVKQVLHHPFDLGWIRDPFSLLDASPRAKCRPSYRKRTGKLIPARSLWNP